MIKKSPKIAAGIFVVGTVIAPTMANAETNESNEVETLEFISEIPGEELVIPLLKDKVEESGEANLQSSEAVSTDATTGANDVDLYDDPTNPDPIDPDPENPDPENPDPENPDPENPDPENPDPENPDPDPDPDPDPIDPGEGDEDGNLSGNEDDDSLLPNEPVNNTPTQGGNSSSGSNAPQNVKTNEVASSGDNGMQQLPQTGEGTGTTTLLGGLLALMGSLFFLRKKG